MGKLNAGLAVVEALKAEGVKAVFGMPGGHTLPIYDGLYKAREIRHILVRHEQSAACMAAAYAQLTGEPGVVCVTAGPGATNLVTGIAEAFVGSLPIVILAGRGPTRTAHKGASQEIAQEQVFRPITKMAIRVDRADSLMEIVRQAFTVARSGKPGPVLVDLPRDILSSDIAFDGYQPVGAPAKGRAAPAGIEAAAAALAKASRPLVVAGGGVVASGAFAELRALAERLNAPVATSLAGRGSFPDDHPLAVGGLGHHRTTLTQHLLPDADVVLGLGCRFEDQETNWSPSYLPNPTATYIQVDIDPEEIGRSVPAAIGLVGDIRWVLKDLLQCLPTDATVTAASAERLRSIASARDALEAQALAMASSDQTPIHPMRVLRAARDVFPRDASVAIDVGVLAQGMGGAFPWFKVFEPRSLIVPSSFYGMGFSASGLPVARMVYPERDALCFVGDGSFQMVSNILPVAVEHRLPVTWCVLNDGALGSILDGQKAAFGGRVIGTTFEVQPDFALLAKACGCHGEQVTQPEMVRPALERARAANARGVPAVIDFVVARERLDASVAFFSKR
ncbi:thiamine pyrophosphate-binding protein [Pseudorhodoferax sp.]|uniref:thiamine pyrophosphate-binding protein n=1 Tax=Pseudorhodoferax sp. TaxID=1993553 RepID=UPI002DD69FD6|nr:thiamine pyrophosphate-binding protein [Pseudorhodoferax sp.]